MSQGPLRTTAVPAANQSQNFAAVTAGTLIKNGAGVLASINLNAVGTVASSITLYDGTDTTGKKLGTWSTLAGSVLAAVGQVPVNLAFSTGLFAVVAGTTSGDITVGYR